MFSDIRYGLADCENDDILIVINDLYYFYRSWHEVCIIYSVSKFSYINLGI